MPLDLQAKLLRVLQEREFQRLGSSETIRVDIRVIAATNCDWRAKSSREFREDLYYRLNVVPFIAAAARAARHLPVGQPFCRQNLPGGTAALKHTDAEALDRLSGYAWPGNVRQLENAVEMAVAISGDRLTLAPADFPFRRPRQRPATGHAPVVAVPDGGLDYEQTLAVIERSILEQALRKTGGNKKAAADMLRLKRTTLSAKVRSLEPVA